MSNANKIPCYYALGGLNFKNGFATSCPIQSDHLHILNGSLPSQFWNNEKFRQHRKDLMSGKWCQGCHLCMETEKDASARSMRMDYPADETYYDSETGAVDFRGLHHVELRFSNSCNMACMHCSDVYSSGWASRLKRYQPTFEDHKYQLDQLTKAMHRKSSDEDLNIDLSMTEMEKIVDDLCDNFPNIEKIDFAGGEVLHQKQFFPCLERLARHPNASNILITFHTNFNARFDPVRLSKLLEPFGRSTIKMSLDAGRNMYSYFRDGNWETLKSNIEKFNSINDFTDMEIVCTTSVYQLLDLPDIFESFLTLDVKIIEASIVFTPRYLNPAILMFDFKEHVINDIEETRLIVEREKAKRFKNFEQYCSRRSYLEGKNTFEDIESALRSLDMIEHYVLNHKTEYKWWKSFEVYSKKIDHLWKKDFNSTIKRYQWNSNNKLQRVEKKTMSQLEKINSLYNLLPYDTKSNAKSDIAHNNSRINEKIDHYRSIILDGYNNFTSKEIVDVSEKDIKDIIKFIKRIRLEASPQVKRNLNMLDEQAKNLKTGDSKSENRLRYNFYLKEVHILLDWVKKEIEKNQINRKDSNKTVLNAAGLQTHSVNGLMIPLNCNWKRVAINLSGGADSCSLAYSLAKIIEKNGYNTKIDIITYVRVWNNRPWAATVSLNVYNKLKEMFPTIIDQRYTNFIPPELEHGSVGSIYKNRSVDQVIVSSFNDYIASLNDYDAIYNATTKNPSVDRPTDDRMKDRDIDVDIVTIKSLAINMTEYWLLRPLIAVEKDWVIQVYRDNEILDLLNTTRSCEGDGTKSLILSGTDYNWYNGSNEVPECGQCFWCHERNWAKKKIMEKQ